MNLLKKVCELVNIKCKEKRINGLILAKEIPTCMLIRRGFLDNNSKSEVEIFGLISYDKDLQGKQNKTARRQTESSPLSKTRLAE